MRAENDITPYRGLIPYSEADKDFFFGRESESQIIIDNLRAARFTVLYGPTGVGKTSVLRAGVAHRLRALARENLDEYDSPRFIVVVFNSWRDNPLAGLAERIRDSVALVVGKDVAPAEATERPLALTLKRWSDEYDSDLLIILDQFEEYFLYHEHESGPNTFDYEFPRAVNRTDLRASFLVSIRDDALSKLDRFKGRIDLFDNYLRIDHLSKPKARAAIRRPLVKYNELKRPKSDYEVEDALVEAVCDQVRTEQIVVGEAGRGGAPLAGEAGREDTDVRIETAYLQLVMTRIWEKTRRDGSHLLRLKTLKQLGGAELIVKSHLDDELKQLPFVEQDAAAEIFRYLVTSTGSKFAHSREDLVELTGLPEERVRAVLQFLTEGDVRLLRTVGAESGHRRITRYEIFHDKLAPAVLDWRARHVKERDQEKAVERESSERQKAELEAQRQERKAKLRFRIALALALLVILSIALGIVANEQRKAAERAQQEAEAQKRLLEIAAEVVNKQDRAMPYFKAVMRGHWRAVNSAAFSPDGTLLLTASADGTARLWEAETGNPSHYLGERTSAVNRAIFDASGRLGITASADGTARIWNVTDGKLEAVLRGHTAPLNDIARGGPAGEFVATASADGTARVWNVETRESVTVLQGHTGAVNDVEFSNDGLRVITASDDFTARVWDARGGQLLATLSGHKNAVNSASFHPDGTHAITASADWDVRLWDVLTQQSVATMSGHGGGVRTAAFSPDGALFVTAGVDKIVKVWDVKTRQVMRELRGHTDEVVSAAFSANGLRVISASADYTAKVWEVLSGSSLFDLRGHTGAVNGAVFSPDGNLAATVSADTTARVWSVTDTGGLVVREVTLKASPETYTGSCPAAIRLQGAIVASGVSGVVRYRFVRGDKNEPGNEKTMTFDSPGTKNVSIVYRYGGPAFPNVSGTFYLEILSPHPSRSNEVTFNVRCYIPPERQVAPEAEVKEEAPTP